jgi:hypothetical protein
LLGSAIPGLLELETAQRRRLFELGSEAMGRTTTAQQALERLEALMQSLSWPNEGERVSAARRLIGAALAANQTGRARSLLDHELGQRPNAAPFAQWRKLLDAPHVGSIALEPPEGRGDREKRESGAKSTLPPSGRWYRGWYVPTQTSVRIRYGESAEEERILGLVRLWQRVLVPGVERVVEHGGGERPYLALRVAGRNFARALEEQRGIDAATCREWSIEACQLLSGLSRCGVELPDADPHRFSVDHAGRLWLVDPWGAQSRALEAADQAHARHAQRLVARILEAARTSPLPAAAREALNQAETFERIVELLE